VHNWLSGASNQQQSSKAERAESSVVTASLAAAFDGHDYSSKGVVLRSVIEALQEFHERDDRYLCIQTFVLVVLIQEQSA
jgi:hypothetical protein